MSQVISLPIRENPPARAQTQPQGSAIQKHRVGDRRRLAHELKNYMSALLLGLASLDREGDRWTLSARSREAFEGVVLEMNRIVRELIHEDRETSSR